jgi:hypothetical protein
MQHGEKIFSTSRAVETRCFSIDSAVKARKTKLLLRRGFFDRSHRPYRELRGIAAGEQVEKCASI